MGEGNFLIVYSDLQTVINLIVSIIGRYLYFHKMLNRALFFIPPIFCVFSIETEQ